MKRRDFLKNLSAGAFMSMDPNSSLGLEEKFADKKIIKVKEVGKVTPEMQKIYDEFNKVRIYGRSFCAGAYNKKFDVITAAIIDELFGNGDKYTDSDEVLAFFKHKYLLDQRGKNIDALYVPVEGVRKEVVDIQGILTATNNPLDYDLIQLESRIAGHLIKCYYDPKDAMRYLEDNLIKWSELPEEEIHAIPNGIIEISPSKTQKNSPLVVKAFYVPRHAIAGKYITTLQKIIPAEYDLKAQRITREMVNRPIK